MKDTELFLVGMLEFSVYEASDDFLQKQFHKPDAKNNTQMTLMPTVTQRVIGSNIFKLFRFRNTKYAKLKMYFLLLFGIILLFFYSYVIVQTLSMLIISPPF